MADYSREQLLQALRRADAAGDADAARAIARRLAPASTDVSNVRAGSQSTEAYQGSDRRVAAERAADMERYNPTKGNSFGQNAAAGFGQAYVSAARGAKQLMADGNVSNLGVLDKGLRTIGLDSAADFIARNVGLPAAQRQGRVQTEVDQARERDAPLMDTGGGMTGAGAGYVSQLVGPGVALRGIGAARSALLPTTIRGNAIQGAVVGAAQPVATGDSRAANVALGGTIGAVVPGAVKVAASAVRSVRDALRPAATAVEEAVRTVIREAADPSALMRPNPSQIPGVSRSLFEETLDPGVARLETRSRGLGGDWAARDSANNAKRVEAIERFAGDESTLAAAKRARSEAATPALERAKHGVSPMDEAFDALDAGVPYANPKTGYVLERTANGYRATPIAGGEAADMAREEAEQFLKWAGVSAEGRRPPIDTTTLVAELDNLAEQYTGNPQMQAALRQMKAQVEASNGHLAYLENARQFAGNQISGTADGSMVKLPDMIRAKDALTHTMREASDDFGQYLDTWKDMSRPINRMQVGQELLKRGSGAIEDSATGAPQLTPGKFGQAVKSLDRLAGTATGFRRATARGSLQPEDLATVGAVNDDLARSAQRLRVGSGGGSHTASQLALGERVGSMAGKAAEALPVIGQGIAVARAYLKQQGAQRLEKAMERVLAHPEEYRAIASLLPRKDRRLLETALVRAGSQGGQAASRVFVPALPE